MDKVVMINSSINQEDNFLHYFVFNCVSVGGYVPMSVRA